MAALSSDEPETGVSDHLIEQAVQSAIDRARLVEWAERIRLSDTPSSWLVERPAPDGDRPGYPSAIDAYREMSAAVSEL